MLPVTLDCTFSLSLRYSLTFICPVSCVPYVASYSGLYFFIAPSVFSNIYLSCVLFTLCYQFLWIVLFHCPFGILQHLFAMCLVYPMLPVSLNCPFLIAPSVFSHIYLSCVLCTLCCQFLWIFHFCLSLRYSLAFICPVSCVPYVTSFSGLYFFIAPSVFSNIGFSCVLCTLCYQFLWVVLFYCPFGIL